MEEIIIVTRSLNEELFSLSGGFLPPSIKRLPLKGFDADTYFYALFDIEAKWLINIDEDVFLWDFERVLRLKEFMEKGNYACCGMPDGAVFQDRRHNPLATNAFFNILHLERLKSKFSIEDVKNSKCTDSLESLAPKHLYRNSNFAFDEFEPYYRFFFWMLQKGFPILYLDALPWARDPISTLLLDHLGEPMLIHLWYARNFNEQRPRFAHAYHYCSSLRAASGTDKENR
ncbi:MAG: hypothetical protein GYA55_06430 [SAR324 cluster bacterium]|uniref:DUF5672 domain-containing protein n=1 Tax=SAR324 cluster bacterium TaxID=2024889 RepID=A0A7X9IK66_9DELT|nr:hypothetical protein [SAR324 cluster bacterium]